MVYYLEINDDDLKFIKDRIQYNSFILNRFDSNGSNIVNRLVSNGVLRQCTYYGEAICYHPTYELTPLGIMVMQKYGT